MADPAVPPTPEARLADLERRFNVLEAAVTGLATKVGEIVQLKADIDKMLPGVKKLMEAKGGNKIFGALFGGKEGA